MDSYYAGVVKLADAPASNPGAVRHAGSTPAAGTSPKLGVKLLWAAHLIRSFAYRRPTIRATASRWSLYEPSLQKGKGPSFNETGLFL